MASLCSCSVPAPTDMPQHARCPRKEYKDILSFCWQQLTMTPSAYLDSYPQPCRPQMMFLSEDSAIALLACMAHRQANPSTKSGFQHRGYNTPHIAAAKSHFTYKSGCSRGSKATILMSYIRIAKDSSSAYGSSLGSIVSTCAVSRSP